MSAPSRFTPQAAEDIDGIWWFIAQNNPEAADRVKMEIIAAYSRLAEDPLMGAKPQDITPLPVRFWAFVKFPKYVIGIASKRASLNAPVAGGRRAARKPQT
jgi:plasmid stabilization system protein ParE